MAQTPRLRRVGIATLAALALVMSPTAVVQPLVGAAESASDQQSPAVTMSVTAQSPALNDIRRGNAWLFKLSDGHYFVGSTDGDSKYQILGADLQPVPGNLGDMPEKLVDRLFAFADDAVYFLTRDGDNWALHKAPITATGLGTVDKLADLTADTDETVTGLALSVDKQTLGVVIKKSTGGFTSPTVTARFLTFGTDGTKVTEGELPPPASLYPEATNTRSDVWSGSPVNPLRGLADGSWLFYTQANVTKEGDVAISNPPVHIVTGDTENAALFTGGDDLISSGKFLNGMTVTADGTKFAAWDTAKTGNGRKPYLYVYTINGGALEKVYGGEYPDIQQIQGVAFDGDNTYVYGLEDRILFRLDAAGTVAEKLSLDGDFSDSSSGYYNAVTVDGDKVTVLGAQKNSWKDVARVAEIQINKNTSDIADKYDFRYTFVGNNGGNVTPGSETEGSAQKKPVFDDKATGNPLPAPPEAEIQGYELKDNTRTDVSIAADGVVTFTPVNSDDIPAGKDKVVVSFPVKVTYKDQSTAEADAHFTVNRPADEVDPGDKTLAQTWAIHYSGSLAAAAKVGEAVTVTPEADKIGQGWNPVEVPSGTTFVAYPEDSDKKLPEGAVLNDDGSITYTAPAAAAGTTVEVHVLVDFTDGSKGKATAFFKVGAAPQASGDYTLSYGTTQGIAGKETKKAVQMLDGAFSPTQAPADARFELYGSHTAGISIDPDTGELTFNVATPGIYRGFVRMYFGSPEKYTESGYEYEVKAATSPTTSTPPTTNSSTSPTTNSSRTSTSPSPTTAAPGGSSGKDVATPVMLILLPLIAIFGGLAAIASGLIQIPGVVLPATPFVVK